MMVNQFLVLAALLFSLGIYGIVLAGRDDRR
jgi:NADH:ubiquinone oxidoreductase subunit K